MSKEPWLIKNSTKEERQKLVDGAIAIQSTGGGLPTTKAILEIIKTLSETEYVIYAITNKRNNKKYIGMTNNIDRRIKQHFNALRDSRHVNELMQNDFKDMNDFEIEIIDECWNKEDALITESYYIKKFKTENNKYGYNNTIIDFENINNLIIRSEKVKDGLKKAKARGRIGGRPSVINEKAEIIGKLYKEKYKIKDIVKETGVSRTTVYRVLSSLKLK